MISEIDIKKLIGEYKEMIELDGYSDAFHKISQNTESLKVAQYNKGYFQSMKDTIKKLESLITIA